MKRFLLLLAALLVTPVTVFGADGCQYIGSWFGYNSNGEIGWTSQAVGPNASRGTMLLELPGFDITFDGVFDAVNSTGNLKGVWERTGGNTFSYAAVSIATRASGDAVYALRLTGDLTVVENCDVLEVDNTWVSIYFVNTDFDPVPIWERDPDLGPIPYAPHAGYRVKLDLP